MVDEKTMIMKLESPLEFLPEVLAFVPTYPIREGYLETYGSAYAADPEKAVYNGPFEITDWKHGEELVHEKRSDYYDSDNISVSKINWKMITNEYKALEAFERGELAYSDLCPEKEKVRMQDAGLCFEPGENTNCEQARELLAEDVPVTPLMHKTLCYLFDDTVYDGLVFNCGCYVFTYLTLKN